FFHFDGPPSGAAPMRAGRAAEEPAHLVVDRQHLARVSEEFVRASAPAEAQRRTELVSQINAMPQPFRTLAEHLAFSRDRAPSATRRVEEAVNIARAYEQFSNASPANAEVARRALALDATTRGLLLDDMMLSSSSPAASQAKAAKSVLDAVELIPADRR